MGFEVGLRRYECVGVLLRCSTMFYYVLVGFCCGSVQPYSQFCCILIIWLIISLVATLSQVPIG
ncbi:uncharacterized protein RJT21DRAFT_40404 [Scheffersomyces amazonensis]|uniref:uncharacterized protein n=1 Tax=Scheffersomyces amazonensis TaxID=1078765 RepID=UPI00315D4A75